MAPDPSAAALLAAALASASLARLAPDLELLAFDARCPWLGLDPRLSQLAGMFRGLRRVEVPRSLVRGPDEADVRARCRSLRIVEVV